MGAIVDNVIQFPDTWAIIERGIRDALAEAGLTDHCINWVCTDFKPRFDGLPKDYDFSVEGGHQPSIVVGIEKMKHMLYDYSNRALFEMVRLEVDLYRALFPDGGPRLDPSNPAKLLSLIRPRG